MPDHTTGKHAEHGPSPSEICFQCRFTSHGMAASRFTVR
jgi:hypothetical protein